MKQMKNSLFRRVISGILALLLVIGLFPAGTLWEVKAEQIPVFTVNLVDAEGNPVTGLDGQLLTLAKVSDGAAKTEPILNGSAAFAEFVEYEADASVAYTASITDATGYEYTSAVEVTAEAVSANLVVTALEKTTVQVKVVTPDGAAYSNALVAYTGYTSGTVAAENIRDGIYSFEAYAGKEYTVTAAPAEQDAGLYAEAASVNAVVTAGENGCDLGSMKLKARYALSITGVQELGGAVVTIDGVVQEQIPQTLVEGVTLDVTILAHDGSRIKSVKHNGSELTDTAGKKEFPVRVEKVEAAQSIEAVLEEIFYNVHVTAGEGGTVKVNGNSADADGNVKVRIDTDTKVEITPDTGKQIQQLLIGTEPVSEAAGRKNAYTCSLGKMAADAAVSATFETAVYKVSINDYTGESGTAHGQVTVNGEELKGAVKELEYNTQTVIKIEAAKGYRIGSLKINGEVREDAAGLKAYNIAPFAIQRDCDVVVSFVPRTYTISFTYEAESGKVEASDGDGNLHEIVDGKVKIDTADPYNVKVTAQADPGKRISDVEVVNGSLAGKVVEHYELNTDDTHTFVFNLMDEEGMDAYSYSVTFAAERFWNVIVNNGEELTGGRIEGLPTAPIAHMDSHGQIKILADKENGYEIKSLKINSYSDETDSLELIELDKARNKSEFIIDAAQMRRDMKIEVVFGLKNYMTTVKSVDEEGKPAFGVPSTTLVDAEGNRVDGSTVQHGQVITLKIDQNGKMQTIKSIDIMMNNDLLGNTLTVTKTAKDLVKIAGTYIYTLDITVTGNTTVKVTYANVENQVLDSAEYLSNQMYDTTFTPDYLKPAYAVSEGDYQGYMVYILKDGANSNVEFASKMEGTALRYNDSYGYEKNQTAEKQNNIIITEDTRITNITASNLEENTVVMGVQMLLVFDGKDPELTMDFQEGWVNAENVVVKLAAKDEAADGDFGQCAGVDFVVWSTAEISDEAVIALKDSQMLAYDESTNTWSHTVTEDQNLTYYYYAVDKVGNVSGTKSATILLEHTKPDVDAEHGFRFYEQKEEELVEILPTDNDDFEWFVPGLIHNEDLRVTVLATDEGLSSGMKEITLYCVDPAEPEKLELIGTATELDYSQEGNHNASATFELTEEKFANGTYLVAKVTDVAGNEKLIQYNHGVQITRSRPAVTLTNPVKTWNGSDVILTFEVVEKVKAANGAAYLDADTLQVFINDVKVEPEDIKIAKTVSDTDGRIVSLKVTVNTARLENATDGRHEIDIRIANNAGTYNKDLGENGVPAGSADAVVYIDRTNPEMTGFGLEGQTTKTPYGNFDNDTVNVTIYAQDLGASNGIREVFLYNKLSEDAEPVLLASSKKIVKGEGDGQWSVSFDYDLPEELLYAKLWIKTVDKVGHESELVNISAVSGLSDLLIMETIAPSAGVGYEIPNLDSFNKATWDGNHWYAGDVQFTVTFSESELESGLNHSEIMINAEPETELADEMEYADSIVSNQEIIANTDKAVRNEDGSYTLMLSVLDNAGNEQKEFLVNGQGEPVSALTVYKDLNAPKIDRFIFSAASGTEIEPENASAIAIGTSYGFYFKQDTIVTIYADDVNVGEADENGDPAKVPASGVKTITYQIVDEKGEPVGKPVVAPVNEYSAVDVPVKAGFKGQIYAYATDNVDRTACDETGAPAVCRPDGVIVETQAQHDDHGNHIAITRPEAPAKTAQGGDLYADTVPVTITVTDTFSGIRAFEWSVTSGDDADKNQTGKLEIGEDFEGGMPTELTDSNGIVWKVVSTDSDLITVLQTTISVPNNSNDILVNVSMTDRSGNKTENVHNTFSIDSTEPIITVSYQDAVNDSSYTNYYRTDRVMVIQVQERNFNAEEFVYAITNGDEHPDSGIPVLEGWTAGADNGRDLAHDTDVYTATIRFHADGDYETSMNYMDRVDNPANVVDNQIFTVDQTVPTVTVRYSDSAQAVNGHYYKGQRVAHITIQEHNFDASRVRIVGTAVNDGSRVTFPANTRWNGTDTHTATITYSADAEYTFDIEFLDMAGNSIANFAPQTFVVDNIDPVISITGVEDRSANNDVVAPVIEVTDVNFDKNEVLIELIGVNNGKVAYSRTVTDIHNGQIFTYADFERLPEVDDIYTLRVTVTDKSGRTTTKQILYSTNRFGSTYDLHELTDINGTYVQAERDLVFYEVNADELVADTIRVKLTKNGEARVLTPGVDYLIEDEVGRDDLWHRYKYTLLATLFEDDGTYNVAVYSVDKATNVNENIDENKKADIVFGVDKTLPVVVVSGLESNEQYNEDEKTVTVQIKDNLVLDKVVIKLNGVEVEYTVDGENYTFKIPQNKDIQDVEIIATDASGREQVIKLDRITVSTDYFILWYRNTPLFVATLIGIASVITALVFWFLAKKKKKEEETA